MPINDLMPDLLRLLTTLGTGGGSLTANPSALNPLISVGTQNRPIANNVFQAISPGQQFGQSAGQTINDLLLQPKSDPRQPQVFNLSPDLTVGVGGQGGQLPFSPRVQGTISPDIAGLLKLVLNVPGLGGSESGIGGFPGGEQREAETPGFGGLGFGLGGGEGLANIASGFNIANTAKNIAFAANRAIGGKDVDRNIDIPEFNFGNVPEGSVLEAYGELGASDPLVVRPLNLTEFSAFENLFPPRFNLVTSAANNVLTALDELGLNEHAEGLRSIIGIASSEQLGFDESGNAIAPRDAIQERFRRVQQLWDATTRFESFIQESIGDLNEQDRAAFNNRRSQRAASELLPQFQSQLAGNTEILTTQQSTQGGDPEVKVLGGGREVPFIAADEPFETIGIDNQIRTNTLPLLRSRIEEFLNTSGR